jgi:ubiquinone/menaquinone biosynthesis C-methylase UbiE
LLTRLAHSIAAHPAAYDLIQRAAGVEHVHRKLAEVFARLDMCGTLLDVGGGTGINRFLWDGRGRYVCLDIDPLKLRGLRGKFPDTAAILADGTKLPVADSSADVVLCKFLTHHLDDEAAARLMCECARVTRPGGAVLIVDPVWAPHRKVGRLLWRYDRGSFPRPADDLHRLISARFERVASERLAVWHEYTLLVAHR